MTKNEIIEILTSEYGVDGKGLNRKKLTELEEVLKDYQSRDTDRVGEELIAEEIVDEIIEEVIGEDVDTLQTSDEYSNEVKFQLGVYETVVKRFEPKKDVRLKNLGAGDLYVGSDRDELFVEDNLIRPSEARDFYGVAVLYITSASRPIVQINYSN